MRAAMPDLASGWPRVEDAAAALDARGAGPALLVVDDLHALEGTDAEAVLARFIDYAPGWLAILVGSRVAPGFNVSRLRVADDLVEVGADDLRFRAWEVEQLFRDHYHDPVPPSDLAVLARRTEGWAAGLQLYHLATRGKSADERRRILSGVGPSGRLVREYLAANVMAELPEELRGFLVEACVLGRLTGSLCDRLLGRHGSSALLEELVRRQIFTVEIDDDEGGYRFHEIFRSYLDRRLVEALGEAAARDRYVRAGSLLEEAGAIAEALTSYCRAEDWDAVRRLAGGHGERLASGGSTALESVPASLLRDEPWLALAAARQARASGRWSAAIAGFARAEAAFGDAPTAAACRHERLVLAAWLDPLAVAPADRTRDLRVGLMREPLAVARVTARDDDPSARLVAGLLRLAAGEPVLARELLGAAAEDARASGPLPVAAALADGVAAVLSGDPTGSALIDAAAAAAERSGSPWLARLAVATGRLAAGSRARSVSPRSGGETAGPAMLIDEDPWGVALLELLEAWSPTTDGGTSGAGRRIDAASRAVAGFRRLGTGVLEAWARGLLALGQAEAGLDGAREAAFAAESFARTTGTPGVRAIAYRALAVTDPSRRIEFEELAEAVAHETGLVAPAAACPDQGDTVCSGNSPHRAIPAAERAGPPGHAEAIRIRTLGGFAIERDGRPVALDAVKPRARALLRLLAVQAGVPVHRDVILEALWHDVDPRTAAHSLHVAVSSLRAWFGELGDGEGTRSLIREGDAYRLALPIAVIDLVRFDDAMERGRAALAAGRDPREGFERAIQLYQGELLPEDGPADWVVERRERYRADVVEAARSLAEDALLRDEPADAIRTCRIGLQHDRYDDRLWRLLIQAREQAGDVGAARRDREEYLAILAALGVSDAVLGAS